MFIQIPELLIQIAVILLLIFIAILIAVLALSIGIRAVKGDRTEFGTVFLTGLILVFLSALISFVFQLILPGYSFVGYIVALIVELFIIKARHNTTLLGALGAIIIYAIMLIVIIVVVFVFLPTLIVQLSAIFGYDLTQLIPDFL